MPGTTEFVALVARPSLRLLIVQDEGAVPPDLAERLTRLGYEIYGLAASARALRALRLALTGKPNVVLMDIHLRGEVDGIEMAKALQKAMDVPVVLLAAQADEATLQRVWLAEPFGFVLKPIDERQLHAAIQIAHYRHEGESGSTKNRSRGGAARERGKIPPHGRRDVATRLDGGARWIYYLGS